MKKTTFILATVTAIVLIGSQAFACGWDGYWSGHMGGPMDGYYTDTCANGDYQEFYDNTVQDRTDLAAKRGEYRELLSSSNPDPKAITALRLEIKTLHDQLRTKARAYGMPIPSNESRRGNMGGCGCGWGW